MARPARIELAAPRLGGAFETPILGLFRRQVRFAGKVSPLFAHPDHRRTVDSPAMPPASPADLQVLLLAAQHALERDPQTAQQWWPILVALRDALVLARQLYETAPDPPPHADHVSGR